MKALEILRRVQDLQAEYVRDVYMNMTTAPQDDGTLLIRVFASSISAEDVNLSLWFIDDMTDEKVIQLCNQLRAHLDCLRRSNETKTAV